jgi:hypothetical protein
MVALSAMLNAISTSHLRYAATAQHWVRQELGLESSRRLLRIATNCRNARNSIRKYGK